MNKIIKYALFDSMSTSVYIMLVSSFIAFMQKSPPDAKLFGTVAFLMLFVFSAAVTGFLVFGKPIMWYIDGKKHEALLLLAYTLGIFFAIMALIFLSLALYF
jgi:hypothetical protein